MRQVELGRSGIVASDWALGTMTFGTQTPEAEAHRQMDMALEAGVTLWDCAEIYPTTPQSRGTVGRSEEILGTWFASRGARRDEVVLATKVGGPGNDHLDGARFGGGAVAAACDRALARLRTDRIDLFQLHWPARAHYAWRRNWDFDPSGQNRAAILAEMDDVAGQVADLVAAGKVRAAGLSNETAWGTMQWLARMPVATVQNEYSLLQRLWDTDMAEAQAMEGFALLAYSPLGAGILSGKYAGGAVPEGSRGSIQRGLYGRLSERVMAATAAYRALAAEAGMDPLHMALAWHRTRPFLSVPIFGATTEAQLAHILAGRDAGMDRGLARRIDAIHRAHPMPF